MKNIELIYDCGCSNVEAARDNLLKAIQEIGISPEWKEWNRSAPDTPDHVKTCGSPTILVNGCDVTGAQVSTSGGS